MTTITAVAQLLTALAAVAQAALLWHARGQRRNQRRWAQRTR
jgi:hypothetical protein